MESFFDESANLNNEFLRTYNCSQNASNDGSAGDAPQQAFGVPLIISGVISLMVYLPLIIAMRRSKFFDSPFYKLNFSLGIFNFLSLLCGSVIGGYLMTTGVTFCRNSTLVYCLGSGCWLSGLSVCAILGFYQCLEASRIRMLFTFFGGSKVWLWMLLLLILDVRMIIYEPPLLIDADISLRGYDPSSFAGVDSNADAPTPPPFGVDAADDEHQHHHVHLTTEAPASSTPTAMSNHLNLVTLIVLTAVLTLETIFLGCTVALNAETSTNRTERKAIRQTMVITLMNLSSVAALLCVYSGTSTWGAFLTVVLLQFNSAVPAFVYVLRNDKLRRAAFSRIILCCSNCRTMIKDAAEFSDAEQSKDGGTIIA